MNDDRAPNGHNIRFVGKQDAKYWERAHLEYVDEMRRIGRERLVVSAVICAEGKVLLVRRSPHDTYPGMWEYPGGGVDKKQASDDQDFEHIVEALRREVKEETGIELPELPFGVVLVHETRTALRIVMRFDLEKIPEHTKLSDEHDMLGFFDEALAKSTLDGERSIFDAMRPENQEALSSIPQNNIGREP